MRQHLFYILLFLVGVGVGLGVSFYAADNLWGEEELLAKIGQDQLKEQAGIPQNPPAKKEVSLIFVGDIMLSRVVAQKIKIHQDYNYPFLGMRDFLKTGDVVFGNLETAIFEGREIKINEMVFRSDPQVAEALYNGGFSILSLANNHTMNFGSSGLIYTIKYLTDAGIQFVGAGENEVQAYQPVYIEKNGWRFAFLAYNDSDVVPVSYRAQENKAGTAFMDIAKMTEAVKEAKQNADVVIVSMHAGNEYEKQPSQRQIDFAHAAIDAGANLIIGHHPHIIQPAEKYNGQYIFYSLGNFIFDQKWPETREDVVLKIIVGQQGISKIEPYAVFIEDFSQPTFLEGDRAKEIISRLGLAD